MLNAAAALAAFHKPPAEGLMGALAGHLIRAQEAVDSGAAETRLEVWVQATQEAKAGD